MVVYSSVPSVFVLFVQLGFWPVPCVPGPGVVVVVVVFILSEYSQFRSLANPGVMFLGLCRVDVVGCCCFCLGVCSLGTIARLLQPLLPGVPKRIRQPNKELCVRCGLCCTCVRSLRVMSYLRALVAGYIVFACVRCGLNCTCLVVAGGCWLNLNLHGGRVGQGL